MTIAIAAVALAVSVSTFAATWWRDKRDLLLQVHDRLTTADQQRGRRLVYVMRDRGTGPEKLSADEHELINSALAAFNTLGIYYHRRYVRRQDVMDLWDASLVRIMSAAGPFLAHRGAAADGPTWPYLFVLADDARDYLRRQGIDPAEIEAPRQP